MTRRRRTHARVRYAPEHFLYSDGWQSSLLTGTPLLSLPEARAAWEQCRAATWQLWAERAATRLGPALHAPYGATCHDELGADAARASWPRGGTAAEAMAAVDHDLAALASFRATNARAAAAIAAELDLYEGQLRWYGSAAARAGDDRDHAERLLGGVTASRDDDLSEDERDELEDEEADA